MTIDIRDKQWRELICVLLVAVPFIFWGLGAVSLLDPDEGMYGSIAREMALKGDWITPHFDGVRYLEKPPLYFWLTALTFKLLGPSEWGTRLWSALPTLGTTILTWQVGRLLYGKQAGVLAAVILVTTVGVFRYTRVAATDSLLVFSLALSVFGFIRTMLSQSSIVNRQGRGMRRTIDQLPLTIYPMLFYFGMALGVLSKGLIGIVFPFLIAGLYFWLSGERIPWKRMQLKWGLLLFLALVIPWHLLAAWKNPGFLRFYFVDNQFLRFLSDRAFVEDDVPVGSLAFLALTLVWFFPWSLFLWGTWRHGFPPAAPAATQEERLHLVVGLWAVTVIGFFLFSSSRLEHYILPALPPLSLAVGASWSEAFGAAKPLASLKWPLILSALGCSAVGVVLIIFSRHLTSETIFTWLAEVNVYYRILKREGMVFPYASVAPFAALVRQAGIALLIGVPLALLCFWVGRPGLSFLAAAGVAAVMAVLVFKLVLIIEPHHSTKSIALALLGRAHAGDAIVQEGALEYSGGLPFYTGRQIYVLNGRRGDLDFGSRYSESQRLFLDDKGFDLLWKGPVRTFLITRLQEANSVLKRLPADEARFLLGRYGSRLLYSNRGS